jgi:uncharacterized protein involved in exopolysaccharide biosynthesis
MDEMFDIRPYIEVLLRRWRLLIGGTVLAGILAVVISFFLPPTYEANALVLIVDPNQLIQFDPRFETVDETRPRQVYPTLAASDSLLQMLLQEMAPEVDEPDTLRELRDIIAVSTSSDPSLLELMVKHRDPAVAAQIANRWAELFIAQANEVVGDQSRGQVDFYRRQRDSAQEVLSDARQQLVEFQARNRNRFVKAELVNRETLLRESLEEQQRIVLLQSDIVTLHSHLLAQSGPLITADQYALLLLFGRAFGEENLMAPLELQVDADFATTTDRSQVITILDTLQTTLTGQWDNLDEQINQLEPEILALQQELQILTAEEEQLQQDLTLVSETYAALARRVSEEEITSQDTSRGLRLAGPAIIPAEPVGPPKLLNGLLAAVAAFAGLVVVVLFRHWYMQNAAS